MSANCVDEWNKPERSLAKLRGFDIGIEDHGILTMLGTFEYEEGMCQGLGYCIDTAFLYRFLSVFGVGKLQQVNGKSAWVTHTHDGIIKIEPLHKNDGEAFDIPEWQEWVKKNGPHVSPYEMRTGRKP